MKSEIKIGFCVAYDWYFLRYALPLVYEEADIICLSLDKDRISWAGNKFEFDETGFYNMIEELDVKKKIKLYEADFHNKELTPMQNEVRQRNMIAAFMGKDKGWHLQLDADEYFLDFSRFVTYLRLLKIKRAVNICCPLITLFRQTANGFLWIRNEGMMNQDIIAIATNAPDYQFGRRNGYFNHIAPYALLHQSWARSEQEIKEKINNWGHKTDFDINSYYQFWQTVNQDNYKTIKNFHPIVPSEWQRLCFLPAKDVKELILQPATKKLIQFSQKELRKKNSLWRSRLIKLKGFVDGIITKQNHVLPGNEK